MLFLLLSFVVYRVYATETSFACALVTLNVEKDAQIYTLNAQERVALEAELVKSLQTYNVQTIEHVSRDPRRSMPDSSRERFEVCVTNADQVTLMQHYLPMNATIALPGNIKAVVYECARIAEPVSIDGVVFLFRLMMAMMIFLLLLLMGIVGYRVLSKQHQKSQSEKRLVEKFGQVYKRHIGVNS